MTSLEQSLDELRSDFRLGCARLEARLTELQDLAKQQGERFESAKSLRDQAVIEADRLRCENNVLRGKVAELEALLTR